MHHHYHVTEFNSDYIFAMTSEFYVTCYMFMVFICAALWAGQWSKYVAASLTFLMGSVLVSVVQGCLSLTSMFSDSLCGVLLMNCLLLFLWVRQSQERPTMHLGDTLLFSGWIVTLRSINVLFPCSFWNLIKSCNYCFFTSQRIRENAAVFS